MERMPSWHMALSSVAQAFPNAKIYVWRYEDFRNVSEYVLQSMCGDAIDIGHFKKPKSGNVRPSPSHQAISEFVQLYKATSPEDALNARPGLEEKYPKGDKYPSYSPWSDDQYAALWAAYEEHWQKIRENPRFNVIAPS